MAKGKFSAPRKRFAEESEQPRYASAPEEPHRAPDVPEFSEEISPAAPPVQEKSVADTPANPRAKRLLPGILAALLGICLIVGGVFLTIGLLDPYDSRIVDNVTLGGIDVGGMTRGEARKALQSVMETTLYAKDMVVSLPEDVLRLSPEDTGIQLDVKAAVKAAYRIGRTGSDGEKQEAYQSAMEGRQNLGLLEFLTYDESYIRSMLQDYADKYDTAYADCRYALTGEMPELQEDRFSEDNPTQYLTITRGMVQRELDVDDVCKQILDTYSQNRLLLEIEEIEPLAVPELPDISAIYQEFHIAPTDAAVSFETYQPVPGSYGYTFDKNTARRLVNHAEYGQTVEIPMEYIEPEILSDEVYFRDVLGSCETKHTTNENRNNNLRLLCEALDGLVLQPGEEFSYNDSVGERTRERGYLPAGAYSGTTLVDAVGGGVCQGSTTLYNCVLLADLEIIFRINHGYTVSYVPFGLDATVNWGGPDFQFRNSSHFPVKIQAEVSDGYVKMKLLGTDEKDYYVKMETEFGYGETALYARSYKCKYDKQTGELISRELEARSNYMLN